MTKSKSFRQMLASPSPSPISSPLSEHSSEKTLSKLEVLNKNKLSYRRKTFKIHIKSNEIKSTWWFKMVKIRLSEKKSFKCLICEKVFSWYTILIRHTLMHTGDNLCTSMNSFILQSIPMCSWLKVNQQTQNREKPFKCVLCEKSYTVSSDLSIHQRTHTGEKPFICKFCEKAFRQFSISKRTFKLIMEKNQKMYNLWKVLYNIFSSKLTFWGETL